MRAVALIQVNITLSGFKVGYVVAFLQTLSKMTVYGCVSKRHQKSLFSTVPGCRRLRPGGFDARCCADSGEYHIVWVQSWLRGSISANTVQNDGVRLCVKTTPKIAFLDCAWVSSVKPGWIRCALLR